MTSAQQQFRRAYRIARLIERHPAPGTDPEDCMITHPITGGLVKLSVTPPEPSADAYSAARHAVCRARDPLAMRRPGRVLLAQQSWRTNPQDNAFWIQLGIGPTSLLS